MRGIVLRATGFLRRYGSAVALDGLDVMLARWTLTGGVGPNGAGTTTMCPPLEMIERVRSQPRSRRGTTRTGIGR